jgi:hypothetical protein
MVAAVMTQQGIDIARWKKVLLNSTKIAVKTVKPSS